ncbi:MAG TPA: ABC transporter permease [Cyclobacteriaceae bacterium]|nr:ABC transporter permease [Cyclobacteriaceae bacterium]
MRWTISFVRWFCPESLIEGIEGDLMEAYEADTINNGKRIALGKLVWNSLKFFRLSIILRNKIKNRNNSLIMLKSYFKLTLRNISRSRGYSFINIFGLSLGIACCLLTANYVAFEFSFDNFHPNVDRTYRVDQTLIWRPGGGVWGSTTPGLAPLLAREYPEIEEVMRINTPGDYVIRYAKENGEVLAFNETKVFAADSNFFNFFGFKLKEGNTRTALNGPDRVVIADHVAKKLFGDEPAVGKIIQLGNDRTSIEISGVTEKQPENTHFQFNYLLSMSTNRAVRKNEHNWFWTQVVTYARLVPGADRFALEDKLGRLGEEVIKPSYQSAGVNYDDFMMDKGKMEFYLRPVRDVYLKSGDNRLGPIGDVRYAYAFGAIGLFVLLIAAINFVNLSTARGTKRAREVGVKKALGALRNSLISQFQTESIFLAIFSMVLAIPLVEILRLLIVAIMKNDMAFTLWDNPMLLIALPIVAIVVGFLAGLYPSFYLTSFRPVQVLKGKVATGMGNSALRGTLVVIQFTISIALLIATVVVVQQMNFIRTTNLGFDKEHTLVINYAEKLGGHIKGFRNELSNMQGVLSASIAQDVPRNIGYQDVYMAEGSNVKLPCAGLKIDENFISSFGLTLIAGRAHDQEQNASDKMGVVVNETLVNLFGWTPETAIGKNMIYPGDDSVRYPVIGVVKDFHFQSLRENINPLFMASIDSRTWGDMRVIAVKYKTDDLAGLIRSIENKWNATVEQTPMDFSFLDDDIARAYKEDQRLGDLFAIFACLSIVIAMIGLVGLVAYSAEVKKKEIGIRKVLGATRSRIVVMMNGSYVRLIVVGLLISTPLSWYAMNYWLETFKFRIEISPLVFILSGAAVMIAALLSVAYLSLRAASVNPASVLKEE